MDDVFDALAHPVRRALLDSLRETDGQSLTALEARHAMTRFGVMKHLRVLARAGLVVPRRVGRETHHYLNPVPIRQVADRWIAPYAMSISSGLARLVTIIDREARTLSNPTDTDGPRHVFQVYVRTTPEALWALLTDDARTPLWECYAMRWRTEWRVGGRITFLDGEREMAAGTLIALAPPRRLVHSFEARWSAEVLDDVPSRVTWEIAPAGPGACRVTVIHDGLAGDTATALAVVSGWPMTLSRLKSLVETGTELQLDWAN